MKVKRFRAESAMSDDEFESKFVDEKAAIDHFIDLRYKGNLICPHCGSTVSIYRERKRLKVFHCSACNNSFSPFRGTIFEKTHIKIRKWFKVIRNFLNDRSGYSACQIERDLKVANAILDKGGSVIKVVKPKIKRVRGTKKTPVVGIKERSTTHVYARVMLPNSEGQKLTGKQILAIIEKACKEGTVVATDDFAAYNILDKKRQAKKYSHVTVNHSKGQYSAGNGIHTNGIENFRYRVKACIVGTYRHISEKYLQRYVDECCFRQNTRLDSGMFDTLLGQCILV